MNKSEKLSTINNNEDNYDSSGKEILIILITKILIMKIIVLMNDYDRERITLMTVMITVTIQPEYNASESGGTPKGDKEASAEERKDWAMLATAERDLQVDLARQFGTIYQTRTYKQKKGKLEKVKKINTAKHAALLQGRSS